MITRMRITEIEAKKTGDVKTQGFEVLFNLEDVSVDKDEVRVKFAYTADYKGGEGRIKIRGEMTAKEDAETVKKIQEELKNKKVPAEYMQKIVNAVNYFGTTNATVIATVMNMVPPIKLPALQFKAGERARTGEKQAEKKAK